MPASGRVQREQNVADFHGGYIIKQVGRTFRVYEDASGYSQTSGQTIHVGPVMRDDGGKPVGLPSLEAARSWIDKGCRVYPKIEY